MVKVDKNKKMFHQCLIVLKAVALEIPIIRTAL